MPTGLFITAFVLLMHDRGLSLGPDRPAPPPRAWSCCSSSSRAAVWPTPSAASGCSLATVISMVATVVLLSLLARVRCWRVASALQGVFRAFDSGPLQAWFIDAALDADPDVDIEQSLANESVVICLSIGAGACSGRRSSSTASSASITSWRRSCWHRPAGRRASLASSLDARAAAAAGWPGRAVDREVPTVMRGAVGIIRASQLLMALVVGELSGASGCSPSRRFPAPWSRWPAASRGRPRCSARRSRGVGDLGDRRRGCARARPPVRRAGRSASASGSPTGSPWRHGPRRGTAGLVSAYLATYWVHSATAPVHYGMVHRGVEASHRATVVSANSLTSQVGGALGGHRPRPLADATSVVDGHVRGGGRAGGGRSALPRRPPRSGHGHLRRAVPLNL